MDSLPLTPLPESVFERISENEKIGAFRPVMAYYQPEVGEELVLNFATEVSGVWHALVLDEDGKSGGNHLVNSIRLLNWGVSNIKIEEGKRSKYLINRRDQWIDLTQYYIPCGHTHLSMPDEDETVIYHDEISVCSYYDYEDEDEVIELFDEIKTIDLPETFLNRQVDIDYDDPIESEIYFGQSGDEDPSNADNRIEIDLNEEGKVHVHPYLSTDVLDSGKAIFENVTTTIDGLSGSVYVVEGIVSKEFQEFRLPDFDDGRELNGIRFKYDDHNFLVQAIPESEVTDSMQTATFVRYSKEATKPIESGNLFFDELLDEYERYLEELLKQ